MKFQSLFTNQWIHISQLLKLNQLISVIETYLAIADISSLGPRGSVVISFELIAEKLHLQSARFFFPVASVIRIEKISRFVGSNLLNIDCTKGANRKQQQCHP